MAQLLLFKLKALDRTLEELDIYCTCLVGSNPTCLSLGVDVSEQGTVDKFSAHFHFTLEESDCTGLVTNAQLLDLIVVGSLLCFEDGKLVSQLGY